MVSYAYPPFFQMGGPPRKVASLAEEIARRGHHVEVLTANHDVGRPGFVRDDGGVRVRYLRSIARYRATVTFNPGFRRAVREQMRHADVLHVFGLYDMLGLTAARAARSAAVPYVLEPLGMFRPISRSYRKKRLYHALFGNRLVSGAAAIVATSTLEREALTADAVPPQRVVVRPNGVDLGGFADLPSRGAWRARYSLSADDTVILFLGRLAPIKRLDLVIDALTDTSLVRAHAMFVGPDEDRTRAALESRAADRGVEDRVRFTGPMYGSEKLEALVDADVLILPSESENFGNVVLEALACGLPVVVSERCGIAPEIDDRVGYVVPLDAERVARALSRVLADPGIRARVAETGPATAARYSWDSVVAQMEAIYEGALAGSGR
jgi:glycosyltransferase involved in cell wall biosynthesis